jgi:hypothetical protein
MSISSGWSAHKLAEFLAAVSSFATEADAAVGAVEREDEPYIFRGPHVRRPG